MANAFYGCPTQFLWQAVCSDALPQQDRIGRNCQAVHIAHLAVPAGTAHVRFTLLYTSSISWH